MFELKNAVMIKSFQNGIAVKLDPELPFQDIYLEVAKENNILSMPFAEIEGNVVDSKTLQKYIMEV